VSVRDARIVAEELCTILPRLLGVVARSGTQIVEVQIFDAWLSCG
jgi:hypothetical protein